MTKLYVYPYTSASVSAKLLAERLGVKRIKLQNSEYSHKKDNLVINWGNQHCPFAENVLNKGSCISKTVDKLSFFRLMVKNNLEGIIPKYWTNPDDIPNNAYPVFCRTTTTGCDGAGIAIANSISEIVEAPLYTQAISSGQEYRVTIFKDTITDIQTKLPRAGEEPHPLIHTYSNGWGFQRKPVGNPAREYLEQTARDVLSATGLDFMGMDVILAPSGKCFVLEVNTAMGLEGQALEKFAQAVEEYVHSLPATPVPECPLNALEGAFPAKIDPILAAVEE